ncbi:MAG TPA: DinB family protein [Candidatus Limnocylindrales bacterium]|nr:DinB family protein [Candidatus Limnocylindrales bacterium]
MAATWVDELARDAPDVVGAWRGIDAGRFLTVRREVRRHAGHGSAPRVLAQLETTAAALVAIVEALPAGAFSLPGGEGDWTVSEAIGHTASARSGLALAASLAASGRWPAGTPPVVTGVPGPPDHGRAELVAKIRQSQRLVARSAKAIAGHETDPCPLDHPLVGRLRCGEWLLFAGVHDVMHLEQLHGIAGSLGAAAERQPRQASRLG